MRDDDPTRNDADDCDTAACEDCGLHSNTVGEVNGRLMCARCFDLAAEALAAPPKRRARKPRRPLDCPHWDYEDPDPDCACVGGHS